MILVLWQIYMAVKRIVIVIVIRAKLDWQIRFTYIRPAIHSSRFITACSNHSVNEASPTKVDINKVKTYSSCSTNDPKQNPSPKSSCECFMKLRRFPLVDGNLNSRKLVWLVSNTKLVSPLIKRRFNPSGSEIRMSPLYELILPQIPLITLKEIQPEILIEGGSP